MLKISKLQFDHLKAIKLTAFCKTVKNYLHTYYEKQLITLGQEDAQMEWIETVVNDARSYGMDAESDVLSYVRAAITFDKNFHELPWAKEVLQLKLMPSTKAMFLQDAMMAELDKMSAQAGQALDHLLSKKINDYSHNNANYVLSFNGFYGLGLNNLEAAEQWLKEMTTTAVNFNFTDDFLLDSYLEVALYFGKDFHTQNWAHNILTSEQSTPNKTSALLDYLSINFGQ